MQIVLPGALPDAAIAQELASHLEKNAPHLATWLAGAQADIIPAAPADTFCTPYEYWLLRRHGFKANDSQRPSAGLAAVQARNTGMAAAADAPLWLGQLVHVAPSRDGAAMIPGGELEITPEESAALFDSAAEYVTGSGFTATPFDTLHWRLTPPPDYQPACASPALVSITSVNDWWTQDAEGRPWRRLVNELQMLWFDHPVNQQRESRGLRPINSVWLYGGAAPAQLAAAPATLADPPQVLRALHGPALVQDWGSWLQELEKLDREVFASLNAMPRLVLTGNNRIVELTPAKPGFLARLFGGHKQNWRRWWSAHN
ncbi:MAG: hypothetical protein GX772_08965 [Alcaligenaceae bacterium]|nr:hypothetical protein [Alcaligenaceae bacterium]